MKKLTELTAFLVDLNLVAAENIFSYVEHPKMVPSGAINSDNSIVVYRFDYTAIVTIESYPHKRHPAQLLFSHVSAWLLNNEADRLDLAAPNIDVEILDDESATIEVSIDFEEDISAVEDPGGTVIIKGKNYRILDDDLKYAETGDVQS